MRFWVKISIFAVLLAMPVLIAGSGWAMTLQESRQKILDDQAFFDAQGMMRRQNSAQALVDSKNLTSQPSAFTQNTPSIQDAAAAQQADQIYQSLSQNQQATPTGLLVSHPDDTGFVYVDDIREEWAKINATSQAFTYDQALAGITMLKHGDVAGAKKIFDFFYAQQQAETKGFSGFWTVYNVDPVFDWKKYEWRKGMGENAWIALFALQYSSSQTDVAEKQKGLGLATIVGKWIASLPHYRGGVAMGAFDPAGVPNFGSVYSVENNLDIYSLFNTLKSETAGSTDRQLFTTEFNGVKNWLQTEAYDSSAGLFRRGGTYFSGTGVFGWDGLQSLDVQSWAITAVGVSTLINDFGISMDGFMSKIQQTFAVQDNGSFGGDIFQAKGFDFSDASNAAVIGRSAMKWVEGTNQMILVYRMLSDFYANDAVKRTQYQDLADHFLSRNADNAVLTNGALSYLYTDQGPLQVFVGTFWITSPGRAVASEAWVYFSTLRINPFAALHGLKPKQPFSSALSVSAFFPELDSLFIGIDPSDQATVRYEDRTFSGFFDATNRSLHLDNVQNSPYATSESWDLFFDTQLSGSDVVYYLRSFETDLFYSDNWLYHHTYDFSTQGSLLSDYFLQMSDQHSVSELTQYTYGISAQQKIFVESTLSMTLFDGIYGYGNQTHYFYGTDTDQTPLTRITVTQETRNDPLYRVLNSYQFTIHNNGAVDYADLGRQTFLI